MFDCSHLLEEDFSIIAHVVDDSLTIFKVEIAIYLTTALLLMLIQLLGVRQPSLAIRGHKMNLSSRAHTTS
jgi:hypothetical protein